MGKIYDNTGVCFGPGFGKRPLKIFCLKPTDGAGDFEVVRTSFARYLGSDGLIKTAVTDEPRRDYSVTPGCGDLLVESQSTNLALWSEDFTNALWTIGGDAVVTSNQTIAPDGTLTADLLSVSSGAGNHIAQNSGVVYTGDVIFSCYVKKFDANKIALRVLEQSGGFDATTVFDFDTETITNGGFEVLSNGWYRIYTNVQTGASTGVIRVRVLGTNGSGYTGTGSYIWGAQLEELEYSTSYIKTEGTIVSRSADNIINGGDVNSINSEEGVLFVERSIFVPGGQKQISITDGTSLNRIFIRQLTSSTSFTARMSVGGVVQSNFTYDLNSPEDFNKIAFQWKEDDFSLWVNGLKVASSNSGITFPANTLNNISFESSTGSARFRGRLRQIQVIKTALTDEELQILTAL